jgi:hypothetical protein
VTSSKQQEGSEGPSGKNERRMVREHVDRSVDGGEGCVSYPFLVYEFSSAVRPPSVRLKILEMMLRRVESRHVAYFSRGGVVFREDISARVMSRCRSRLHEVDEGLRPAWCCGWVST